MQPVNSSISSSILDFSSLIQNDPILSKIKDTVQEKGPMVQLITNLLTEIVKDSNPATVGYEKLSFYISTFLDEVNKLIHNSNQEDLVNKIASFVNIEKEKINLDDYRNLNPLIIASSWGDVNFLEYLLDHSGIDINAKTESGATALSHAILYRNFEITQLLTHRGAKLDGKINLLLVFATILWDPRFLEIFINQGLNPNASTHGVTLLGFATELNHLELIKALLDKGADPNQLSKAGTPLYIAASKGYPQSIELLMDRGASPAIISGGTPLCVAIQEKNVECVKVLLDKGTDPNQSAMGFTPVYVAAVRGDLESLKLLFDKEANPNQKSRGDTPLYATAFGGYLECAKLLLDRGANLHEKSTFVESLPGNLLYSRGTTATFRAACNGHLECLQLFLDRGGDPNEKSDDGITPLCAAIQKNRLRCVEMLLDYGAKIDEESNGETPLQIAIRTGNVECENLLRKYKSREHQNPMDELDKIDEWNQMDGWH